MATKLHIKYNVLCCGCLCSGRKMHNINEDRMKQCFVHIIREISMYPTDAEPVRLCWECEAQLRNFIKFKQKVKHSYKCLSEHIKQDPVEFNIQPKPKLSTHTIINLSLKDVVNTENQCEEITSERNIVDENDHSFVDTNSDNETLCIIKSKKTVTKKKVKKEKLTDHILYREDDVHDIKKEYEKLHLVNGEMKKIECVKCKVNFDSNVAFSNHDCIILKHITNNNKKENKFDKRKRRKRKANTELYEEVELSREQLEEERRLAKLRDDYVNAMFKCERCIMCFANTEDLKDHINIKHDLHSTKFECPVCERSFGTEVTFNYHMNKHTRRYRCVMCAERGDSKRSIMKHYENAHCHGVVMEYGVTTPSDNGHNVEEARNIDDQSPKQTANTFPCEMCEKTFRWKTSLRKHLETHRIETGQKRKPYCEPCRLSFTSTSNLQKHVKTSSKHQIVLKLRKLKESQPDGACPEGDRARIEDIKCTVNSAKQVFACPQCEKRFQWRGNMLRHVKSHAARAKGELVCEPCNRTFSSIATYKQHMQVSRKHVSENEFKYMCSDCGKRFANKTRLKDHINWEHLKHYLHTCSICQKVFKSHTSLYLHKQVVHKIDKAEHLCHQCGKAFPNNAKLLSHLRGAHKSGAFKCAECDARFSWHSCLSRHARRAHKLAAP